MKTNRPFAAPSGSGLLLFVTGLLALFAAGCGSTKPASASFASVVIRGHEPAAITKATVAVFQEDGYTARAAEGQLIFEKEASRMTNIAYEGLGGAHYGAQTLVRVKVSLVDVGAGAYRLQGQTYIIENAGDTFFTEEHKLKNIRSRPYQALLEAVAARLK
jgi:hypothetical protein